LNKTPTQKIFEKKWKCSFCEDGQITYNKDKDFIECSCGSVTRNIVLETQKTSDKFFGYKKGN